MKVKQFNNGFAPPKPREVETDQEVVLGPDNTLEFREFTTIKPKDRRRKK